MAGKFPGLYLDGYTYYVRMAVPADVREKVGKRELIESLRTGDRRDAERFYPEVHRRFKNTISQARTSGPVQGPLTGAEPTEAHLPFRNAMGKWGVESDDPAVDLAGPVDTPWQLTDEIRRLHAAAETGDFTALPDFDETFREMITAGGGEHLLTPAFIAKYRRDAAKIRAGALQFYENLRLLRLSKAKVDSLTHTVMHEVIRPPPEISPPAKPLPAPSLTLRKLFNQWKGTLTVSEKEQGRLEHQMRRLIEVVGDKPANHLTKLEVRDFMALVARFPGRKRSAELSALPMAELIERFESNNAAIAERNATAVAQAKATGVTPKLEVIPATLTATTVDEWFGAYRRMFDYAVVMLDFDSNPFVAATKKYVVKGAEPTKKREFTEAEIKFIFESPTFNGFEGDGMRGYRNKPGPNIVRDAKFWLPILALFHGGRLTEFAAMPHSDLKQSPAKSWYFDLTRRQVKNETSQRLIPLHPKMIDLGFLDYVASVREGNSEWLFPDLDHETKHGPGHAFSKWWGNWMNAMGLTDPSITHHSWRHTFKRAARQSDVKEEMHDVLTGHRGSTVSRQYGQGADIEPLARDMAKIVFPTFPALPVATF